MRSAWLAALAALSCGTAAAQQANVNLDYNPQRNTLDLVPFTAPLNSPDVRDDRTVTFRLKAPEAKSVSLAGVAMLVALGRDQPAPFQKGADGVWSLSVGPLRPDMYVYHLVVDGVQMADPNNTVAGFTAMPPYSQLVVHGDGPAYYDARDVPHGSVTRHVYHSGVTKGERELYVYRPRLRPQQDYRCSIWSAAAATCPLHVPGALEDLFAEGDHGEGDPPTQPGPTELLEVADAVEHLSFDDRASGRFARFDDGASRRRTDSRGIRASALLSTRNRVTTARLRP